LSLNTFTELWLKTAEECRKIWTEIVLLCED